MSTMTLVASNHDRSLPTLTLISPSKEKTKKKRRRMAGRRLDVPQHRTDLAGASARVKRFHSKSRKGCLTCRQRRVKCDEQRIPNCLRCDKGGYVCEWQDTTPSRSRASEDRTSGPSTRSPSLAPLTSDDESMSHRFFSQNIVAGVVALFTDMAESFIRHPSRSQNVANQISSFYYQHVYHASQASCLIRRTLTALCGLHERNHSGELSPRDHEYITRYSEAVTELRTSIHLTSDLILISSILFANCEYLMGDLCSAVRHLRAGSKILHEHQLLADGSLSHELTETLHTIFEAFDHNRLELDVSTPGSDNFDSLAEHQFDDLSQANTNLLEMYNHTFALKQVTQNRSIHVCPVAHDFRRWSTSWRTKTATLEETLDTDQLPWLYLLHGQQTALNTVIDDMSESLGGHVPEMPLDNLTTQISSFLQTCADQFQDAQANRPYPGNVGLILPLYLVALRAGDSHTCEKALSLLLRLRMTEGTISSCCAHAVARAAVNARHAARFQANAIEAAFDDRLPVAEVKRVVPLDSATELDVSILFPHSGNESNAIVGSFCPNPGGIEDLCAMLETGGFQGPVTARRLENCNCFENII